MPVAHQRVWRLAVAIRGALAARPGRERAFELPTWSWNRCAQTVRQLRRAELRDWKLAANVLSRDLVLIIPSLVSELTDLSQRITRNQAPDRLCGIGDIYRDLAALVDMFHAFDGDVREQWLSVTTEPITLEGVYLGPFEIRLEWGRPGVVYRVVACQPHPAESRESVTHPHVMDEQLCEGDSRTAIRQALAQGRLYDFFMLVAAGLRSYNPESPFVALAVWRGASCTDCGAFVVDEGYACESCQEIVCDGCETTCAGCEHVFCSGCTSTCPHCSEISCRGCLQLCIHCRSQACGSCLDSDERCANCHEELQPESIPAAPSAGAAVQRHVVGQAPVPA